MLSFAIFAASRESNWVYETAAIPHNLKGRAQSRQFRG